MCAINVGLNVQGLMKVQGVRLDREKARVTRRQLITQNRVAKSIS